MRGARANFLSDAGGTAVGLLVQAALLMVLSRTAEVNEFAVYLSAAAVVAIAEISADFGTRIRGLGYFATRLQERLPLSAYRRPLLGTGFCGALTTFSTTQLEMLRMPTGLAVAYASASIAAGLAAVFVTTHLARWSG